MLTGVVALAEKAGKHIELAVVPGTDPCCGAVCRRRRNFDLRSSSRGRRPRFPRKSRPGATGTRLGATLPEPRPALLLEVYSGARKAGQYYFPDRPARASTAGAADIELVHCLWRELTEQYDFGPPVAPS